MPAPVSKKQFRMMMAILHGKQRKRTMRGDFGPPKSVAEKYKDQGTGGDVESKGKEHHGGKWTEAHYAKHSPSEIMRRAKGKSKKKKLKKALDDYMKRQQYRGAGCLVVDDDGRILLGMRSDNGLWSAPGGHVEPGETFEEGALRELTEEAGINGHEAEHLCDGRYGGYDTKQFIVRSWSGEPKTNGEFFHLHWFRPEEVPVNNVTEYTRDGIAKYVGGMLKKHKSLPMMLLNEELQKNISRTATSAPAYTTYELTHGDALRLVGNGVFRFLRDAVKDMSNEELREIPIDTYVIHIRKHVNDVYSGWVTDGHKHVHQWTNRSLPALTAELMSIFEWYLPEDQAELEILDERDLDDTVIEGGLSELVDKYRKHNITNIYQEMENIREEIRNGAAVDIRSVEERMMRLFNRLEDTLTEVADKHNQLADEAGDSIDYIEQKLMELQSKIDELSKRPVQVEAYSSQPVDSGQVHDDYYPYLSKPSVVISPSGHIKISFSSDWSPIERENFIKDMRARVIRKK